MFGDYYYLWWCSLWFHEILLILDFWYLLNVFWSTVQYKVIMNNPAIGKEALCVMSHSVIRKHFILEKMDTLHIHTYIYCIYIYIYIYTHCMYKIYLLLQCICFFFKNQVPPKWDIPQSASLHRADSFIINDFILNFGPKHKNKRCQKYC